MKEIVKVLLQEGIDEETIHEVLDIIEENYEAVNELHITDKALRAKMDKSYKAAVQADNTAGKKLDDLEDKMDKNPQASTFRDGETDLDQEVRLYPKETAELRKVTTERNRQTDRYHRARDRYNKRNPKTPVENKFADSPESVFKSSEVSRLNAEGRGRKSNIYKKESDHWGWAPKPSSPQDK